MAEKLVDKSGELDNLKKSTYQGNTAATDSIEEYDVRLNGPQDHSCECLGFLRWGHCKHLETLSDLIAQGKLAGPGTVTMLPVAAAPVSR